MKLHTVGATARAWLVLLAGALFLVGGTTAASGQMIAVEAEAYDGALNIGEFDIGPVFCSVASNKEVVTGLDLPGEWIRLEVTIPEAGCYDDAIAFRAPWSSENSVLVTFIGAGAGEKDITSTYSFVGAGVG